MLSPSPSVSTPIVNCRPLCIQVNPLAEDCNGIAIAAEIIAMPIIEPMPNNNMYIMPVHSESMVSMVNRISAAEPAMPCIRPTKSVR